jgi:hypothetical protein
MTTQLDSPKEEKRKVEVQHRGGASDAVYGIGLIGAWVYYISHAKSFQAGAIGFFKAFAWPALVVYKVLVLLESKPSLPNDDHL